MRWGGGDGGVEMGLVDAVGWGGDRGVGAEDEGWEIREGRLGVGWYGWGVEDVCMRGRGGKGRRVREVERCLLKTNRFRAAWQRWCARINEKDGLGVV